MAGLQRIYNQDTGGFTYKNNGQEVSAYDYSKLAPGGWYDTLKGSNRKEDNLQLSGMMQQSGVADGGASKGVLQGDSFNKLGSASNQENFTKAMMQIMEKHSKDEQGEKVLNSLRNRMEGMDVNHEDLKDLPPDVRNAVLSGNIARIASEMGRVRQTMQGRAQLTAQALDFVTNRYDKMVEQAERARAEARDDMRWTLQNIGPDAFADYSPEQIGRIELELDIPTGQLNRQVDGLRKVKAEQERLRKEEQEREEARYREQQAFQREQFERSKMESDRSYGLQVKSMNQSNANAEAKAQQDFAKGFKMERFKDDRKSQELGKEVQGLRFTDPTGATIPMAEYFAVKTGGNAQQTVQNMISTLRDSHSGDRNLSQLLENEVAKHGEVRPEFQNEYWWLYSR